MEALIHELKTITPGLKVFPIGKGKKYGITYKGFYYVHHRVSGQKQHYRCYLTTCKARIHLSMDHCSIAEHREPYHNHFPDPAYGKRRHFQSVIKNAAKTSSLSTAAVVVDHVKELSRDEQAEAPTFRSLQKAVRRARIQSKAITFVASTRAELPLLYGIFTTHTNEDFVKWDSGRASDRILIFSTDANLDTLQACEHWFADGTFKSCPELFEQFFVVHGYKTDGHNVLCTPLVYVLTPNRIIPTYKRIFDQLKVMRPRLAPKSVMADYEKGLRSAFSQCFKEIRIRGCYFHFRQAIQRKIQGFAGINDKMDDPRFNLKMRYIVALAFVPPSDVIEAYEELEKIAFFRNNKDLLDPLLTYFVNTWIGGFNRLGRRTKPDFPINGWNCYDAVLEGLPKTNNFCEGFHNSFLSLLAAIHPKIPKFVDGVLNDMAKNEFRREQFDVSRFEPPKTSTRLKAEALLTAVRKYGSTGMTELKYLRNVALLLKLK